MEQLKESGDDGDGGDDDVVEEQLWKHACQFANVSFPSTPDGEISEEQQKEMVQEEIEALEAIFPSDCQVTANEHGVVSSMVISMPEELTLRIVFDSTSSGPHYPLVVPKRVLCTGNKWPRPHMGVAFHVEIAKHLSTLPLGDPMVFEIYGQMQLLLQTVDELPDLPLAPLSTTDVGSAVAGATQQANQAETSSNIQDKSLPTVAPTNRKRNWRRPRERSVFWSTPPKKTPPAVAFPKLSQSLEQQRKGLPAGQARDHFLSVLKEADNLSYHPFCMLLCAPI